MKNACRNFVPLDKLRARLTKKNIISLLILPVIAIALFTTPTAAFARSNERESSSPSPAVSNSLISIHMLDKTHGWALTPSLVLKTADGGLHWQNITPANGFSNNIPSMREVKGTFLNDQDAWIVTPIYTAKLSPLSSGPPPPPNTIRVLRTTNGGKSWQSTNIQTPAGSGSDTPHFLSPLDGWLQTFRKVELPEVSAIFHTTDGGLHWNEPGKLNMKDIPHPSGPSFIDNQNGWEAGDNPAATMTANPQPLLEVTHDGGKTWQSQPLPTLHGADKSDWVGTKPPVFFGNNGLLPVEDHYPPSGSKSSQSSGLDLYVTHNGGQTWTPTQLITSNVPAWSTVVDIVDSQHAWATLGGANLYSTSTGGPGWTLLPQPPQRIDTLDFIDANNGWAMNSNRTTPSLLHTTDGGHTWHPINYFIDGKPITTSPTGGRSTVTSPTGGRSTVTSPTGGRSTNPTPVG